VNFEKGEILADFTILKKEIEYQVNKDGTFTRTEKEICRVNTETGINLVGQRSFRYSPQIDTIDIKTAFTTKVNGLRVDVEADGIIIQQSKESVGAPMFDDHKVKILVFPGLEIGAVLTMEVERKQFNPLFPGNFSFLEFFSVHDEIVFASVTVKIPESLTLHTHAINVSEGEVTSPDNPAAKIWRWTFSTSSIYSQELHSVDQIDYSPRIVGTTFQNLTAVGRAYTERTIGGVHDVEFVKNCADEIVGLETDPKQQAELIYDWVTRQVRYVAIHYGLGGVVPHNFNEIFTTKYGDCKDHVFILGELLRAKGIKSYPVLINSGKAYWTPDVPAPLAGFDHVIIYLPEFDLFLDSTSRYARFGILPFSLLGKKGLAIMENNSNLVDIPLGQPKKDSIIINTEVELTLDGDAHGFNEVVNHGTFDLFARQLFSQFKPGSSPQVAAHILSLTGQNGSGNYTYDDVFDSKNPFRYKTDFKLIGAGNFPGPGAIKISLGLGALSGIGSIFEICGIEKRNFAIPAIGRRVQETITIRLPEGVTILAAPKPVEVTNKFGSYFSNYHFNGKIVTANRELYFSPLCAVIESRDYSDFRAMGLQVNRDLNSQIVYS